MSTEPQTALTVVQRAVVALGYNEENRKGLTALAGESKHITAITNADGREQAHAAMMKLKNTRIAIEKRGKAAREDATAFSKAVISEEDSLVAIISPEEARLQTLRDQWDTRIENERRAKVEAEQKRQAEGQGRINDLRSTVNGALRAKSSADVVRILADVQAATIDPELYHDYKDAHLVAKSETVAELERIRDDMIAREQESARLAAERAEFDRQRAEQAERDRTERARRDAETQRVAEIQERLRELRGNQNLTATSGSELIAEHLYDLDKLPTDAAIFGEYVQQAVDAKAAGMARLEALLKAAREHEAEQQRLAVQRAENERIAAEQAAAQKKIDDDRRELEARQQAERDAQAKKEREEREAEERRVAAELEQRRKDEAAAEDERRRNYRPSFDEIVALLAANYRTDTATVRTWITEAKAAKKAAA